MEFMSLVDRIDIVSEFVPVNMNTGANTGTWIDMAKYKGVLFIVHFGIGTVSDDVVFVLNQAKTSGGGSSKALNFPRVRAKIGATSVEAVGQVTEYLYDGVSTWNARTDGASPGGATNSFTIANGADEGIIYAAIKATDLDVQNGFQYANLSIATPGATKLGSALAILFAARYNEYQEQSSIV